MDEHPNSEEIVSIPNFIILDPDRKDGTELPVLYATQSKEDSIQTEHFHEEVNESRHLNIKVAVIALFVVLGGVSIGAGVGAGYAVVSNMVRGVDSSIQQPHTALNDAFMLTASQPTSMVHAVEVVKPSVVSIDTITVSGSNSIFISPFFDQETERPSAGTGVVFYQDDTNVYIVTNEHVIENAVSIEVTFGRGTGIEAFVLGRDIRSDIAVIYVPWIHLHEVGINNVTVAEFGNSSDMHIGEFVMAIGNALGQGITTTMGVVSATDIQIRIQGRELTVLQTDAAINPGNSGGPLINSRGQVIGINTVKISRDDAYGMGYSITSNVVVPIIDSLMNETARPILGIRGFSITDMSQGNRENVGQNMDYGVLIATVQRGSGAYRAGLQQYDIITHFNGVQIKNMPMLQELIWESRVGEQVTVSILRGTERIDKEVLIISF